ncbi:hypothetical protein [Lysobacter soyae]|uniref:Uncharacterized protein n=1 Tax=Lysobacter soyae TaxID=2764185 RepID=A0ABX8WR89_9GAMM|nr:hypothetical protein [Lysobacter sp. CJ11]QYR53342.1 hypothetical protein H8L67_02180 [Lysobacter sp. CJ11]
MKKFASTLLSTAALAMALVATPVMAQSTPAGQVRSIKENIKQDARSVTQNIKQDWRDLKSGNLKSAHERHKRVIRGDHQRHRTAVRRSHERRMTAAQCLVKYGKFDCQRRGYRYGRT